MGIGSTEMMSAPSRGWMRKPDVPVPLESRCPTTPMSVSPTPRAQEDVSIPVPVPMRIRVGPVPSSRSQARPLVRVVTGLLMTPLTSTRRHSKGSPIDPVVASSASGSLPGPRFVDRVGGGPDGALGIAIIDRARDPYPRATREAPIRDEYGDARGPVNQIAAPVGKVTGGQGHALDRHLRAVGLRPRIRDREDGRSGIRRRSRSGGWGRRGSLCRRGSL